ncbi:geopeptide [Geotalea uraniireducens]|nr:geopeptide [Geotalea uraniireducens]
MKTTQKKMELEVLDEGRANHEELNTCCSAGNSNRT